MTAGLYPWQAQAWQQLHRLRGKLPHAILFHGAAGIGKTRFAEQFAQALLCEAPGEAGQACGKCISCGWFAQYSHPDFRRVRPEALDDAETGAADVEDSEEGKKTAKASKAPSREIKIDQVRALTDFVNVSTHRQGVRVIVLYPADALNTAAANALLKTLEEPPPDTVYLLVANSLDRLLPTIVSRCRKFALSMPEAEAALAWLREQGIEQPDAWLSEHGGAPIAALEAAQDGQHQAVNELLAGLARPDVPAALKLADRLQKEPALVLVAALQRWVHDLVLFKLSGRIRYYPRYEKELMMVAKATDIIKLVTLSRAMSERRAIAEHPLSAKLFVEDMLLDYVSLFS